MLAVASFTKVMRRLPDTLSTRRSEASRKNATYRRQLALAREFAQRNRGTLEALAKE